MEKLYLIDGMSLVFRAYHAMVNSNLKSHTGELTYAVYGFINIMHSIIKSENPKNLVVAFDTSAPTFRHELYDEYKANRAEFPEPLVPQLLRIKQFLSLAGIPQIEYCGFEADDIIGSIAKQCRDYEIICVTEDKDYYQLVDDRITLLKLSRTPGREFIKVDLEEVERKFGGRPEQVRDVLSLIGDSSDNIPGVKGIGDKTAIPLIQKYGSLDNLYAHIDEIAPAGVKNKLIAGKDDAYKAMELVTIKTDMEIPSFKMHIELPDSQALYDFFTQLNFNQFKVKWLKDLNIYENNTNSAEDTDNIELNQTDESISHFDKSKVKYTLINEIGELIKLIPTLERSKLISVDTETSSLDKMSSKLAGISLSVNEDEAFYIAVEDENSDLPLHQADLFATGDEQKDDFRKIPVADAVKILKPVLENADIQKSGQNIKFDAIILKRYGVTVSPIAFDTMVAGHIIDPDSSLDLDSLSLRYLNYQPIKIEEIIGVKKPKLKQKSMTEIDPEHIRDYACEDADIAFKLKNKLEKIVNKNNQSDLAREIEFPLIEVLVDMEYTGVKIDDKSLGEISEVITKEIDRLKESIFSEAGEQFNIDSPKQLGEILFNVMMIPPVKKTKTGYSTDVETLNILRYTYPIADYLLNYRQLNKLKTTYIDTLPLMINPDTGRLHTNYNQNGTNTGRLSSNEPNLQNIPIKSEIGKEIRKAFIGEAGNLIVSADYSQIELRIMAYFTKDKNLTEAFQTGQDIHSATASILNGIPIEEITQDHRRIAKTVNFGIMYGLGAFGLSQRLGLSRTEGSEIIKNYFEKYPGIKKYMDDTIKSVREKGYAETVSGRRRYFPDIDNPNNNIKTGAERAAINMPIQGTASDMIKIAMIRIYNAIREKELKAKMIMQVHDELVFECPPNELQELKALVKHNMEAALPLGDVPVIVEVGSGSNWLEAH